MINLDSFTKLPNEFYWCIFFRTLVLTLLPVIFLAWIPFLATIFLLVMSFILILLLVSISAESFIVSNDKIIVKSGVITKSSKIVPYNQIQNIENIRGVADSLFGLAKIRMWTSSPEQISFYQNETVHKPTVTLTLKVADAEWLQSFVIEKTKAPKLN